MTPSQLKYQVELHNPDSLYFSKNNMKGAGDSMGNYGVRKETVVLEDGETVVYELYRKRPVKYGLKHSVYFRCDNFKRVYSSQIGRVE